MVLRLRNNALALAKMQMAMLALTGLEQPETEAEPWHDPEPAGSPVDEPSMDEARVDEPFASEAVAFDDERVLAGDALSRFVSRPLAVSESPHEAWRQELESDPVRRRRNAVLPGAGFRSPSS